MEETTNVSECLQMQLCEIQMLQSMFPTSQEFSLDKGVDLKLFEECLEKSEDIYSIDMRLGFCLNLKSRECLESVELVCQYPHEYPVMAPNLLIRTAFSKQTHSQLSGDLTCFLEQVPRGELCICAVIDWLLDRLDHYSKFDATSQSHKSRDASDVSTASAPLILSRMWIYSHHLYSKIKRKDLIFFATQLNLSGFSMPGKPGIIVVEGASSAVEEFWGRIRRWQWKRIVMKEKEDMKVPHGKTLDDLRKLDAFSERFSQPTHTSKSSHYHGDRGQLYQYLDDCGLAHVFPYFFGVEGKAADVDTS